MARRCDTAQRFELGNCVSSGRGLKEESKDYVDWKLGGIHGSGADGVQCRAHGEGVEANFAYNAGLCLSAHLLLFRPSSRTTVRD